jgi:hypothetical protein
LNDPDRVWTFKGITKHEGPISPKDVKYLGSRWNVFVQWEDGSETWEPLAQLIRDDPITCAEYAQKHNLLGVEGWKVLNRYTRRAKKFERMLRQNKLKSFNQGPVYKFGVQVPRNKKEAWALDKENGNDLWDQAIKAELNQLDEYKTFDDRGHVRPGPEYQRINVHLLFDAKHDLRRKARMVAGGHLTKAPLQSIYSGVVSLRSIQIALLAAELNGLTILGGDVGNAYLEADTEEKVYIIAGPEFGSREGHVLVIQKALYGLRSSGFQWHEKFADTLREEGFIPSKADPELWYRDAGDIYEYICVYVDDLLDIMKDPQSFMDKLTQHYGYKLKGVGPPSYHLGANYSRDPDGTLCMGSRDYVDKILKNYERVYGEKPAMRYQPLDQDDHPEVDVSELLPEEGIVQYQPLVGELQWAGEV